MFALKRTTRFIEKERKNKPSELAEEIYDEYHTEINRVNGTFTALTVNDDRFLSSLSKEINQIYLENMDKYEVDDPEWISAFHGICIRWRAFDPECTSPFDSKKVVNYFNRSTDERTLEAFEATGRNICEDILQEYRKKPEDKRLKDLCDLVYIHKLNTFNYNIDPQEETDELGKLALAIKFMPDDMRYKAFEQSSTIEDLPNNILCCGWETCPAYSSSVKGLLSEEIAKRTPETEKEELVFEEAIKYYRNFVVKDVDEIER